MRTVPTPGGLLNAFCRRWVLGMVLGLLAAAAAAACVWLAFPRGKHEVRAVVQIRPRGNEPGTRTGEDADAYRNQQASLLRSRDLLARTVGDDAVAARDMVKKARDPVAMLDERITVKAVDDTLVVSLVGDNLDDMKVILERLVGRYVEEANDRDRKGLQDQVEKLEALANSLNAEIAAGEKPIGPPVRTNGTTDDEGNAERLAMLIRQQGAAEGNYHRAESELRQLEEELALLTKQLKEKSPPDPARVERVVNADPRVTRAAAPLDAKKTLLKKAIDTAGGRDDVPYALELKADIAELQGDLDAVKKRVAAEVGETVRAEELARKAARVRELEDAIKTERGTRDKLKEENDGYKRLISQSPSGRPPSIPTPPRDTLKPQREALDRTNATLAKLRLDQKLGDRLAVRGEVEKVSGRSQNEKVLFAGLGGFAAFYAAALLVAILEWRTRRVDSADQVVSELGMRVIGTVPLFPSRADLKAAAEPGATDWQFVLNESINSARTMLLHAARTHSMQVVMVTSATQGEGKTSLASQLAASMATAGMRALVVDCDLRNPSIQKVFEVPLAPGVSEVLRQEVDVADAVQATAVPNLWVIPAGQYTGETVAALAQGHPIETLFNRLRGQFDFVIVDSSPVLPVADALLIGQHVDGVVFSIMQDVSQLPNVKAASEMLNHLGVPLVGAVVHGVVQDVGTYDYAKPLPA